MSTTPDRSLARNIAAKRKQRQSDLARRCRDASDAVDNAKVAVTARDELLADSQGPREAGKFTYDELVDITGLSRTRINQIIQRVRRNR